MAIIASESFASVMPGFWLALLLLAGPSKQPASPRP